MLRTAPIRTLSTREVSASKLDDKRPDPKRQDQAGDGLIGGLVNLFFGVIISIVALRFIFRLLGANGDSGIVSWIYTTSQPLVTPFFGIFHGIAILNGRIEPETVLALIVYGVVASVVTRLFGGYHRTHAV